MKLFLIAAPIIALAVFVLVRALAGRPLSRFVLNVTVALFLLAYVLVTAALGIFWVARMDLPAFDLHYLFGYCVVLLVVVHLSFQLRILATFLRRLSPKAWLVPDGSALRPRVKSVFISLALAVLLAPLAWLGSETLRTKDSARVVVGASRSSAPAAAPSKAAPQEVFIERAGERISVLDYLHEESSYSRAGVLRSVPIAPSRPLEVKRYESASSAALPAPREHAGAAFGPPPVRRDLEGDRIFVSGEDAPSLADVAELCHYSAGVTSRQAEGAGVLLRAAASSGALYPVDLYVIARTVRGLEAGVYYYEPHRHALLRTPGRYEPLGRALVESEALHDAPLAFVAAVTFDRTVVKYNVRSYRYVALDAGHVVANLSLVARALGLSCRLETTFDDERAGRALSLDPEHEAALLVAICDRAPERRDTNRTRVSPETDPVTLPPRADGVELTRLSHRLTSFRLKDEPPRHVPVALPRPSSAEGVPVPAAEPAERDLFETIRKRRSFRDFADSPIRLEDLAAIARDATRTLPPLRGSRLIELYLLVRSVAGLAPGAYRFDAERSVLEPRARGDRSSAIQSAALSQEVLGRAAVVLAWSLADDAGTIDGARDYRTALIEAGLAGELAYLSASARGLGLCGVGAFYDAEVDTLLAHGARRPRALYLQGLGAR